MELTNEGMKIMIIIMGVLLTVFLSIIGYFMTKRDKTITDATENLTMAVEQLKIVVNGLQNQYSIREPIINERLEKHSSSIKRNADKVEAIDLRLTKLETEHTINCSKHK